MTEFPVFFAVSYLTETGGVTWRTEDYDAWRIVKGMKGESFKGYSQFKISGSWKMFTQANMGEFVDILIGMIGSKARSEITGQISVVPIPNSGMAVGAGDDFRAIAHGERFSAGYGAEAICEPVLRWDAPREKVHLAGGFRSPDRFEPHLRLIRKPKHKVVLFDDVLTTGSQMTAAARFLIGKGITPALGVVVSRATKSQNASVLAWDKINLQLSRHSLALDDFG